VHADAMHSYGGQTGGSVIQMYHINYYSTTHRASRLAATAAASSIRAPSGRHRQGIRQMNGREALAHILLIFARWGSRRPTVAQPTQGGGSAASPTTCAASK
jgi:hypothetical protein